ncbi:polyisoprenoid-binding protein [Streptomyces cinereoruber]|uniref:Polyisoprenoid-binding protein n=1 Tax=Streptomyces cinereoruber TaxID=67260 RepID=A0AAV4K9H5_9ACTN|nr:YceI family protein [Streptomyces cinereoruber]MBB4158450.1 polyisoprenoid-binding protein YceI [Streptomyces cinereoruber]MBY8814408.1 YceI family protein [Streptomyces cinereoruber]NIH59111.1 polyisoprenoid-binding protein YceI [Streptomyces cinereoruber]QEV34932.1 polyisoprenoid-binding protein [Streptomyces cinereoruber]GGR03015.1 polyisoprenoid-binding protein [Streptomyces cinereoruber]
MGLFGRKNTESATAVATLPVDPALAALTGEYTIDPAHSSIGFTVRHAMVTNVRGTFAEHEGTLKLDGTDPGASTASIDVRIASVDTGIADRDNHLRSSDFFDAERFPLMSFRSTRAEQLGGDTYRITGDLTIKDVTRPLSIDLELNGSATDVYGNERVGFEGSAEILRSDWGLTWNAALEAGGVMVSDKVKLTFDISAIKNAA